MLPDVLCKRIIDEQITPRFKAGDFDGGLTAGVSAILAATKGEYQGTGATVAEHHQGSGISTIILVVVLVLFFIIRLQSYRFGGIQYWGGGWSGGGSSGGWSGGGGGGGGFSGGGGSSGGGGAGGSW